ncbi:MAG TPA: DUF1361 domain-containing protein, partial [Armatimonadota bacterium]
IASLMGQKDVRKRTLVRAAVSVLAIAWFAFLPNTCYLLTEWRHFLEALQATNFYVSWTGQRDVMSMLTLIIATISYLCYSLFGLIAFALSIRPVARLLKDRGIATWLFALPFFSLMSLGVYLGLELRFNSWDILTRPWLILTAIHHAISRPILLLIIFIFGLFLWLVYWLFDIWFDGLALRLRPKPGVGVSATSERSLP